MRLPMVRGQGGWGMRLLQAAATLALLLPAVLHASQECGAPDANGIQLCKAGLSEAQISNMRSTQEKPQWCWAASIEMVFAHHGFVLTQERIVRQHFGDTRDGRVGGTEITRMVGQSWQDGAGRSFTATATPGNAPQRRFQFSSDVVVRELAVQRPLIIGALGHAMVLVQVDYEYFAAQDAVRITGGTVIDPAPGRGVRQLDARETHPGYVAAVQVSGPQKLVVAAAGAVSAGN